MGRNISLRRFSIAEATFLLLIAYVASKVLGAIRQSLFNSLFGTGPAATAYIAAFSLPSTILNLIAAGALIHAFIPVFLSYEKARGEREVWRLASLVFNLLLVSLTALVLVAELVAPVFVTTILVPGLPPSEQNLTTALTRIMLLQPLILGLGTIATAILNGKRQFFPQALSIAVAEFGLIGGLLFTKVYPSAGIYGPTAGVLLSAIFQVAVQLPAVYRQGVRYVFTWDLKDPGLRQILRLLGPNLLTVGVVSIGAILTTSFASYLPDPASIVAIHNAFSLYTIPLAVIAQIVGLAYLPQITLQATHGRFARMSWTILKVVGTAALTSVLAALVLSVLGKEAIHIVFRHGAFDEHAATLTNLALIGYAIGLPGQTISSLLLQSFYAMKDARTPLFVNIAALGTQVSLSFLLLQALHGTNAILGLPLAVSLAQTILAALLVLLLYVRLRAKVKTDKGWQRLQLRRRRGPSVEHLWLSYEPTVEHRAVLEYRPALEKQPTAEHPAVLEYQSALENQPTGAFPAVLEYQPEALEKQPTGAFPTVVDYQPALEKQSTAAFPTIVDYETPEKFSLALEYPTQVEQPIVGGYQTLEEYEWMVLLDPGNLKALVHWHIAMITNSTDRARTLAVLTSICKQLRDEERGIYELVIQAYTEALAEHPDNADVHFALGQLHQQAGNYPEALEAYMLATPDSAVEVMARYGAAKCLLAQGKPQPAIEQLQKALQCIRHTPTDSIEPGVWMARPRQEDEEHQAPEAEISSLLAKASISVEQQDPQAHEELVDSYLEYGLLDAAITELGVLVDIYLNRKQWELAAATMRRMSNTHATVGDVEEALTHLRRAIEFVPDDLEILRELVIFCLQLGYVKEAAHYQMTIVHHYLDNYQLEELVAALQQLIVIDPDNSKAYSLLEQTYQSVGEYEQANQVYRHSLKHLHSV